MRRLLIPLLCLCLILPLAGRRGVHANFRELEQLLVIRTMGLDEYRGGVELTLASSASSERGPKRLRASGTSVTAAMDRLSRFSYEEDLFCAHIEQLLVGEKEAEVGLDAVLAYIERSPELRLDLPLYVVKGDSAAHAVMNVGGGGQGICEVMETVSLGLDRRGDSGKTTAARIIRDTDRYGAALICTLICRDASESEQSDEGAGDEGTAPLAAAPEGYAVLREGKLCRYLTREQGIAVGLLKNQTGAAEIPLRDKYGGMAVVELTGGSCRIEPIWTEGVLAGLNIRCSVQAALVETRSRGAQDEAYLDALTAALEEQIARYITSTLEASKELEADFLGLAALAERADPAAFRALPQPFAELLPRLELELTVSARLNHANDRKDL